MVSKTSRVCIHIQCCPKALYGGHGEPKFMGNDFFVRLHGFSFVFIIDIKEQVRNRQS